MDEEEEQIALPHDFMQADVDHIVLLIVDMLGRLIAHNDKIPLSPSVEVPQIDNLDAMLSDRSEALTRFHSRTPPAIPVLDYLRRIVRYTKVERSCLLITLHYIDQICARTPSFTISSLTVHRFLITSIAIASKALCDAFFNNTHYAKVGGITRVLELNLLEREFLVQIEWRLVCTRELLQTYYVNLIRTHSLQKFRLLDPVDTQSNEPSPTIVAPDTFQEMEAEPEAASGVSISSASHTTSPSFSAISGKSKASAPSNLGTLGTQGRLRGASTGLIPGSSSDLASSSREPPPPTLEQNIAFETHISETQEQETELPSSSGKRSSKNAFVPDEIQDEARPPIRRKILPDGAVHSPS